MLRKQIGTFKYLIWWNFCCFLKNFLHEQNLTLNFQVKKLSNGSNCAFFYQSPEVTFDLIITLNANLDIQCASSNSNPIENTILTNNYLKGMKMLLTD